MAESATHTFFSIPELVILWSTYVPIPDLTRCTLVCREWSRQLQPRLWMVLKIDDRLPRLEFKIPSAMMVAVTKNLHHVRTVDFTHATDIQLQLLLHGTPHQLSDTVTIPGTVCSNLKRINIRGLYKCQLNFMIGPLIEILGHNPYLTHLAVPPDFFANNEVPVAISKLWHLQHLTIHASDYYPRIWNALFVLQSCLGLPELTELDFGAVRMGWDTQTVRGDWIVQKKLEKIISMASMARASRTPKAKKIKSLRLPANTVGVRNPLPLLLLRSNLVDLEMCEVPWFRLDADIQEIEQVVRDRCPKLKHLRCPAFYHEDQDGQAACAFIRGCSGIQSFTSAYFSDRQDRQPRKMLSELLSGHHTTLEALELTDAFNVLSYDLQEFLCRCKQLRRFWVMCRHEKDNLSGIAFRDIARSNWVSTELRELGLAFTRGRPEGEEEEPEDPQVCDPKRAFQQIGRLEKLEVLHFDVGRTYQTRAAEDAYARDLTLSDGWLGELAGLRKLKRLGLRADFWSAMGQPEVEFMYEHWPLLREITISCDVPRLRTEPHWQWLLEKLPQLRLVGAE